MMRPYVNLASTLCVYFLSFFHFESALAQTAPDKGYEPPLYRNVLDLPPPQLPANTEVRLLADDDFAPYSFLSSSGAPGGLSVELAMSILRTADENGEVNDLLSDRQVEILQRIADGLSTKQVARELGISHKTVYNHLNAIYRRLDTQSLTHAVLSAVRKGIIHLDSGE